MPHRTLVHINGILSKIAYPPWKAPESSFREAVTCRRHIQVLFTIPAEIPQRGEIHLVGNLRDGEFVFVEIVYDHRTGRAIDMIGYIVAGEAFDNGVQVLPRYMKR